MTQGHHSTHTGLQKHSVGNIYPLAIVGVGDQWQLHNLENGTMLCDGYGRPLCGKPSYLIEQAAAQHTWCFWSKPPVQQPVLNEGMNTARFIAPKPLTGTRADWYGEPGTDAELPPPGVSTSFRTDLTEQERLLILAYRACLPMMRECILTLVRKCTA